ncbi:amino acid adenylation domain-containing protein [bacterium]|nr:amino acid adenylation domain-containing protein [bacterium]
MTEMKQRIADLSPEKRALLEQRLAQMTETQPGVTITARHSEGPLPLSFAQERIWFLEALHAGNAVYNEQSAFRLSGLLDVDALRHSMEWIVERHQVLRTVFTQINGRPMQVVLPKIDIALSVVDLRWLAADKQEAAVNRITTEEAQQPFNLETGPLYRTTLIHLAEDEYILVQTRHHIATDGWSTSIYWRELNEGYNAARAGRIAQPSALPVHYADYAMWQRQWLAESTGQQQLAYWRNRLARVTPLELPVDRPRSHTAARHGGTVAFELSAELAGALRAVCRQEKVTPFMFLLAAFQLLLNRYSGQKDIAVGAPVANRNRAEIEGLIGFFANTLVLRSDLSGNPTFQALLQQVRQNCLEAYAHQDLPFEKLVEDLQPARHLERNPLFDVLFVHQKASGDAPSLDGVSVQRHPHTASAAKFDLSLSVTEVGDQIQARLHYSKALFEAARIERMATHFQRLLQGAVHDLDCPIQQLPIVSQAEINQILFEWNSPTVDSPQSIPLHRLFEVQAERRPKRVAVVHGNEQWTYQTLNKKAEQIAQRLRRAKIGHGDVVGICCGRSPELIAGVLGIIKVGAAYLPLDPTFPAARLHFMLGDASAVALLTTRTALPQLALPQLALPPLPVFYLEDQTDETHSTRLLPSPSPVTPESLAYIAYTSGSTGVPKGVMIPQRAVTRLVLDTNYIAITEADSVGQAANFSFDAATFEIWGALLNGACLVILDQQSILSPLQLAEQIRRQGITTLFLTTALFNRVAQTHPQAFTSLRRLLFGGETADPQAVASVLHHGAPARLIHVYGPTESTTFASWHEVKAVAEGTDTVPIGRALKRTQLYVLDNHGQLLPPGIPGELYIGGDGLAQGYLNQPTQTESRFVAVDLPFIGKTRLYRTGDRVYYQEDGEIEFLGRFDNQVKIRGYRIEPGEIENVLARHEAISKAVVLVHEETPGEKQLVAYCESHNQSVSAEGLRLFLQAQLPAYMIPAEFVFVDTMPLTPNGKIDLRQLRERNTTDLKTQENSAEVRDLLDAQIKTLWQSLLKTPSIGLDDDFFALGGHSLLAATLFAEIERLTGKRLPLSILFETPTLRHLCDAIRQEWSSPWKSLVAVQPKGHKRPIFLVPPAAATGLRFAHIAEHLGAERPIFSFESIGMDGISEPHNRVEEMAAHYISEMRLIQPKGPYLVGGMCFGAFVALEMAQSLQAQGDEVAQLVIMDAPAPQAISSLQRPRKTITHYLRRGYWHLIQNSLITQVLKPRLKRYIYRVRSAINPIQRQRQKVISAHWVARQNYISRPYRGSILLFQSEVNFAKGEHLRWAKISEHLVHHLTPGTTHRDLLLAEPYVGQWVKQLRNHLNTLE